MALRAWYPLNGSAGNRMTGGSDLTQTTAPSWADGKVVTQAMTTGGYKWSAARTAEILNNEEFSYACWFYVDAASGTSASFQRIFGNEGGTNNSNRRFTCGQYPTVNGFHVSSWNGSSLIDCCRLDSALPSYQWTHICFTYKKGSIKVYINGVLQSTRALTMAVSDFAVETQVLHNYSGRRIQDVRIYDNAITAREVRELAEGMVYHFPLNNQYCTGTVNKYSGDVARGNVTGSSATPVKLANEEGYKITMSRSGSSGNYWFRIAGTNLPKSSFSPGTTYVWSISYRVNKCNAVTGLSLRRARYSNDYTLGGASAIDLTPDHTWKTVSATYTITQADYDNTTNVLAPCVEMYSDNLNDSSKSYILDIDLREVQIIEAPAYVGWIGQDMASTTITGGGVMAPTLTRSGTIKNAESPVYGTAYDFNQTGYLYNASVPIKLKAFTMCFWLNPHTAASKHYIIGTFDNNLQNGMAIYRFADHNFYTIVMKSTGESTGATTSAVVGLNNWSFVAITWDAAIIRVYVNGTLQTTYNYGGTETQFKNLYLGNSADSNAQSSATEEAALSDFRLYATCFSADRITELYRSHTSVASPGTLVTSELVEGKGAVSVKKTGQVQASGFASIPALFGKEIEIEPDGSAWLKIVHHADPTTYLFASSDTFSTGVYKDNRRWFMGHVCSYVNKWEFMVELSAGPDSAVQKFRWVQQYNPNTATFANVAAANVTKYTSSQGYDNIESAYGGIYKFNSNTYYCANNGTQGNWWGAIGAWANHKGGIPAYSSVVVKDGGYEDLWLRIDNVTWNTAVDRVSFDRGGRETRAVGNISSALGGGVRSVEFIEV